MENVILIYMVILGLVIGLLAVQGIHSDENLSQRLARVRVRVDDRDRRRPPEPHEDEFDQRPRVETLVLAAIFLFLVVLLRTV